MSVLPRKPATRPAPLLLLLCSGGPVLAVSGAAPAMPDPHAIVRGMTVSCQTWGREWGTDDMVQTLVELRAIGVNWVAIHPYAGIRADGTVVVWDRAYDRRDWLERPIEEAHRLGLKIMIKPHLAYWGSPFAWRGDIAFDTAEQWERFFATYRAWITQLADICKEADAFVVGTELDRTTGFEDRWRELISAVRQRTSCPLTYAANWADYQQVAFWDALDVVGIQAYFPLTNHDETPTDTELQHAWSRVIHELEAFSRRHDRKILFTELGYDNSTQAARRPWSHDRGSTPSEQLQKRCLDTALQAVERSSEVVGAFLWKWFAGQTTHENFLKSTPTMKAVIRARWLPRERDAADLDRAPRAQGR